MPPSAESSAPDFTATDKDGASHELKDFRGKWVILYFYPKDDTSGCTLEAKGFRDVFAHIRDKIEVIGVSADSEESHAAFAQKYQLPFLLLSDPDRTVMELYGATKEALGKRVTFLINPQGVIKKIYQTIDCGEHADEVLRDMAMMGA